MNELTQRGINALKANDRASARKLLAAALQQDQNDASAWLWLAAAMDTPGQRIDCLRQVLKIEPNNQAAIKGLAALGAPVSTTPPPPSTVTPQPVVEQVEEPRPAHPARQTLASQPEAAAPISALDDLRAMAEAGYANEPADVQEDFAEYPSEEAVVSTNSAHDFSRAETSAPAAAAPVVSYRPPPREDISEANARKIFNVRPSNVPAVLAFWVFFFGSLFLGSQINALNPGGTFQGEGAWEGMPFALLGLMFSLALGLVLTVVVLYVILRNARTHYELTSASLSLPFRGRRARIPIHEIYSVNCRQSFFQKLYGAGDILLDAAVQGELAHVRLRSVPGCQKRVEEITYLIRDNTGQA